MIRQMLTLLSITLQNVIQLIMFFPFFNAGHFSQSQTVSIRFTFPDNSTVSFDTPEFFAVNTEQYQNVIQKLKEQPVSTTTDLNTVKTNYRAERILHYSLPFLMIRDGQPL